MDGEKVKKESRGQLTKRTNRKLSDTDKSDRSGALEPDTDSNKDKSRDDRSASPSVYPSISLPEIEKKLKIVVHRAWNVISFESLPDWLKDNEFLHHNHRPPMYSFRGCIKSMFRLHTETLNIWTHFLGFLFFVILLAGVYIFGDYITFLFEDVYIHQLPLEEQIMLLFYFVGALLCLSCSAMFHLFANHSEEVSSIFSKLDYSGIAFQITGSSIPAYYYGFYCTTYTKYMHILVLMVLCLLCITVSMWNKFATPAYRPLRFGVFVLFGLYGSIPSIQIFIRDGYELSALAYSMWGMVIMAATYIFGATLYVLRIPERLFPGKFDIWASSHQLFHVCVVTAALVHYNSLLNMVKYRLNVGSCIESLPLEFISV